MALQSQKNLVARFMRRLYAQRLTTCSGGNISLRVDANTVLLTPSRLDKGSMTGAQIGVMTTGGRNLTPRLNPTVEASMHLAVLRARPDIAAVVHAHPATASAFAASRVRIRTDLIAESLAILGAVAYTPYALQGTQRLARIVARAVEGSNVVVMANHGVLTVGATLLEAFNRIEVLEAAACITATVARLGSARRLTGRQIAEIQALES